MEQPINQPIQQFNSELIAPIKKSRKIWWILGIVVGVVLILGGVYWWQRDFVNEKIGDLFWEDSKNLSNRIFYYESSYNYDLINKKNISESFKFFTSDISGKNAQEFNFGKDSSFSISKDGRYIAKIDNGKKIEIALSENLNEFKTIVDISLNSEEGVEDIMWFNDSSRLLYKTRGKELPGEAYPPSEYRIYQINNDGSNQKLIGKYVVSQAFGIVAIKDDKNVVYMATGGEGAICSGSAINLLTGEMMNNAGICTEYNYTYSSDSEHIFYVDNYANIVDYNLNNSSKNIIYKLTDSNIKLISYNNNNNLLFISPADYRTKTWNLYSLNLLNNNIDVIFEGLQNISYPLRLSYNNNYLAIGILEGNNMGIHIIDIKSKILNKFLSGYQKTNGNIFSQTSYGILGWLSIVK